MCCHDGHMNAMLKWTVDCQRKIPDSAAMPAFVAKSEIQNSLSQELPCSGVQALTGTAPDLSESPSLPTLVDAVAHMPPLSDASARIQALEVTPEPASFTVDEIQQAQADDDSLRSVLQALKDQTKPRQSDFCQYPEDAQVLLSQWDLLILQEGVVYRKFHYSDGSTNFLQIVLLAKLCHSYIERLHADLGHFGWTKTCYAVSCCIYFPGWHSMTGLLVRNCAVCSVQSAPAESTDTVTSGT